VEVSLIDRRNFHVFSPMLYQAATGALAASEVSQPLRSLLRRQRNTRVILGEAADIEPTRREVRLVDGTAVPYDTLIVATGRQHSYFGNDQWREHAPGLKTLEDAAEIRRRVLLAFEAAEREPEPQRRRAWMTLVVVGGGPTGVELAGALGELARDTLRNDFRSIDPREARVILVEALDRLLLDYPAYLAADADRELTELGVTVRTGTTVTDLDATHVEVRMGQVSERIETRTVIWAAGVRPGTFGRRLAAALGAPVDRGGRIVVEPGLSVPGHPEVLVVGDMAAVSGPDGRPVPAVAQGAMQGGTHAAKVVAARLRGEPTPAFRYRDIGDLAMVGRFRVIARLPFAHFAGPLAWLIWLGVHLYYLSGFQNRLLVTVRWVWSLFTRARANRLITGAYASHGSLPPIGALDVTRMSAGPAGKAADTAA
jgi:NADH dehydrogenase